MITKIFGENCKRAKVIDVLLSHPHSEYTKTDISEIAEIHRTTLNTFIDELVSFGLIEVTRKIGKAHLYKINLNSPITQALNSFQNQLADIEIEKEVKKYEKEHQVKIQFTKPFEEIAKRNYIDMVKNHNKTLWTFTIERNLKPFKKVINQSSQYAPTHYALGYAFTEPNQILLTENSNQKNAVTAYNI